MILEDSQIVQKQVAKIGCIQDLQTVLIGFVDELAFAFCKHIGLTFIEFSGCQAFIFPAIDKRGHISGRPLFFIDIFGFDNLFDETNLIICIQDRKIRFQSNKFRVNTQDLRSNGVERAQPG